VALLVVSIVGVVVSLAAWCFLAGINQIQQELYTHLPHAVGYQNGPPKWWPLPVLAIGALIVALAIGRLPGNGCHISAEGLSAGGPSDPSVLPGVILAGLATIASGLLLGPEAPLIAIGGGLAALTISLARRDTPPQALMVVAAAGSFAVLSFIFTSPLIAAVILIEADLTDRAQGAWILPIARQLSRRTEFPCTVLRRGRRNQGFTSARLPIQAGVAVGMGAAVVAVVLLPLSVVVLTTPLTSHCGRDVEPLIIVVVSCIITLLLARKPAPDRAGAPRAAVTAELASDPSG
jgi:H+/Cl- antiporter ClcA